MSTPAKHKVGKAVDSIQQHLTDYAIRLNYDGLSPEAVHAAKARIIDTLGALIAGFFGEPCRIARDLASRMPNAGGATVIGTRMKTTPDMAAFVNATTARYPELTDSYHGPGSSHGHASDMITPLLGMSEHANVNGRSFITAVVLAYEVFLRISDVFHNRAFDTTNFCCLGTAVGGAKLFELTADQLAHGISMAIVPNNILRQVRMGEITMFKAAASGQAGRAGVFAALLARAGMEGPHLPFEGKAGWCDHVARERFTLSAMGGAGEPFKILQTQIKMRPSSGETIPCILAAEKIAPLKDPGAVERVIVEANKYSRDHAGADQEAWNPATREAADHSLPYTVATTLIDGTITLRSFDDAHLSNPTLRSLIRKVEVVENDEFSLAFDRFPVEHRTRITVVTASGERLVAESGGDKDDLSMPRTDAEIEGKFRSLTEDYLGAKRVNSILQTLWHLEDLEHAAAIPAAFVLA